MAEYIERGELIANLTRFAPEGYSRAVELIVEKQPAADVAPVRHGLWVEYQTPHIICCSCCDWGTGLNGKTEFCPNCGAKMDGGNVTHADQ